MSGGGPVRQVAAICNTCGTIFGSGVALGPGAAVTMIGNTAGPCPRCGGMGTIPDGIYEWADESLEIVRRWTMQRRQRLLAELERARRQRDRERAEAAVKREPELAGPAQRLLVPRDAGQFWAFVAVLMAAIALLHGGGPETKVECETVIEHAMGAAPQARPPPQAKRKPPPPPPPRKAKDQRERRHKRD